MFEKVLVPVDAGEPKFAQVALDKAARLARDYGTKIHLLTVCHDVQSYVASQLPEGFQEQEVARTMEILENLGSELDVPAGTVEAQVRIGSVYHEVIEEAKKAGCDLVCRSFDLI